MALKHPACAGAEANASSSTILANKFQTCSFERLAKHGQCC